MLEPIAGLLEEEGQKVQTAFVALSKFAVINGTVEQVKQAFRERPHLVDGAEGFIRLEVLTPTDNADEIWLLTYWANADCYHIWHKSHLYRDSHKGIPKGIKLDPKMTELRYFDYICS